MICILQLTELIQIVIFKWRNWNFQMTKWQAWLLNTNCLRSSVFQVVIYWPHGGIFIYMRQLIRISVNDYAWAASPSQLSFAFWLASFLVASGIIQLMGGTSAGHGLSGMDLVWRGSLLDIPQGPIPPGFNPPQRG